MLNPGLGEFVIGPRNYHKLLVRELLFKGKAQYSSPPYEERLFCILKKCIASV